ncbi:hypothetical protein RHGRI_019287 [Rhododendron griersonianum]|uniref:Pentatricopeptide repeat-containing protein n=1 Tax=Rhododendron griersonianum TaxID=479676 RepID=A0AAV6JGR2_9ERIC|nr:hypothetical protein RHGRI_019287 [Rhododendron griersonianum]
MFLLVVVEEELTNDVSVDEIWAEGKEEMAMGNGLQTHARITRIGLSNDTNLRNHLVNLYSKCGAFGYARKLIDECSEPDLVSWSALVSGYARNGFGEEALLAFREMYLLGLRCNEFTLPSVLKACSITKGLMPGKQVHGLVMVTGFESDVFVANTLVVMYAKCGALEDSRRLFDLMPERNIVSWNALFSCYVQNDIFEEALGLFREMILRGIRPDEYSLSCILNACTGMGDINQGKRIHGDLIKRGYDSDPFSANALVDMYAKGGDLQDSMAVFEGIGKPDIVSWNAIIAGCVLHEYHDWALKLFRRMKYSGTCPNMFTLSSALKACAGLGLEKLGRQLHSVLLNMNIKSDPFVSVGLIDMYCKSGLLEEAKAVYWLMPQKDLVALNAMISGLSQNGEEIEALYLCSDMYKEGIGLNETTMCAILNSTASLRAVNICKQVHALSVKSGLQSDVYVSNSLIDSYGKCENVEDACKVFEECPFGDLASFTSMIASYAQCGQGEEALKLYIKMQDMELKPDPFVCSSLLNACANLSAYEQGKQIHVHILKFGFMSDGFAGNSLVNMYAKCGSVDDASRAFSEIPDRGIVSWSAMIGGLAQHGHGKEALNLFTEMLKNGISPNHVRRRMKESNVKKEPGISWMEVKDKVHTFIVGDRSHSRSGEIYAKLDELRDLMNKAGYVPMVEIDLHDVEESEKELLLFHHSEKLAVAFGLIATPPGAPIRIKKNLRVCLDCHTAFKFICKIVSREIVVRDMLKTHQGAEVDIIDRVPTPCGLVRSSVALDHPKTKVFKIIIFGAIRRATIARKFIPVYLGSAFKNKGVQPLLDGVVSYLPCPTEVMLSGTPAGPLAALAFKLEEGRFGIYEGFIRRGDSIINVNTGKKVKVPRLGRMHSNEMEEVVVYLPIEELYHVFHSLLNVLMARRFFLVWESCIWTYMLNAFEGNIRCQQVDATVGKPRVNFRETVTQRTEFDYLHKKQTGGQGQYGRVTGGSLIGHPVENIRVALTDGASHAVDSSELAFKLAAIYAFRKCYPEARLVILEPIMLVELKAPTEFQGTVTGDINKRVYLRKGVIVGNDQDGDDSVITADVPLNNMFGYSTSLRSMTQVKQINIQMQNSICIA